MMQVLKIVAEGLTTSFRYPHFMHGIHPSFEMPPPATIYGHICSALGYWVEPEGIEFAYHFTFQRAFDDLEHIHLVEAKTGKIPGTSHKKVLEGIINPFKRTQLFRPKLILYLNRPDWEEAFVSPKYTVVLGRSQDLFTYTTVKVLTLFKADRAYFEHTLVPYKMVLQIAQGYAVLMPRYLDYKKGRSPTFNRYLILKRRVHSEEFLRFDKSDAGSETQYWIDKETPEINGAYLGLFFHRFVGEDGDGSKMA